MYREGNRRLRRSERMRANNSQGVVVSVSTVAATLTVTPVVVASWTSSGGRYYYDLAHGKGRPPIALHVYDSVSAQTINIDELEHDPDDTGTLDKARIWLGYDPGASRIVLYYI